MSFLAKLGLAKRAGLILHPCLTQAAASSCGPALVDITRQRAAHGCPMLLMLRCPSKSRSHPRKIFPIHPRSHGVHQGQGSRKIPPSPTPESGHHQPKNSPSPSFAPPVHIHQTGLQQGQGTQQSPRVSKVVPVRLDVGPLTHHQAKVAPSGVVTWAVNSEDKPILPHPVACP